MIDYLHGSDVLVGVSQDYYVGGATGYSAGYFVGAGDDEQRANTVRAFQRAVLSIDGGPVEYHLGSKKWPLSGAEKAKLVDGVFGKRTRAAVKRFNNFWGHGEDGEAITERTIREFGTIPVTVEDARAESAPSKRAQPKRASSTASVAVPAAAPSAAPLAGLSAVTLRSGDDDQKEAADVPEESVLTKKIGPLPTYAWGMAALAVGLGVYLVMPDRAAV